MVLQPDAELSTAAVEALVAAYGLGRPIGSEFIARGAMGAVSRLRTRQAGGERRWTVKRSYWDHYTEEALSAEADFTDRCRDAGIAAPRSLRRLDNNGFVLIHDHLGRSTYYRVLEWVEGETATWENPHRLAHVMGWLATMHQVALDPGARPIDPWFTTVGYNWEDLAHRASSCAPDMPAQIRARMGDLTELTTLANAASEEGAIVCHTDIDPSNVIWAPHGPTLIDWENSGPLVPHQELACLVRAQGARALDAYRAYRHADGPAELSDPSHFATSIAIHLNYLGCQIDLMLDDDHPEQHAFARASAEASLRGLPDLASIEHLVNDLRAA